MVAVIKTGHSIRRIFNYNEQKVKQGVAKCIAAENYPKDLPDLTLSNKLNRLLNQAALNEHVTHNSVHISLNFDPFETLSVERLREIAETYMQGIGFGEQPYLVYQHHDAGHPHIHIVSINVREDGSRIDLHNIGRNQSEKTRKEIENRFGLVKADERKMKQCYELKSAFSQNVQYGKMESRNAIAKVLEAVVNTYRYTSLPELNAVLRLYNVQAERGSEDSRVFKHQGLLYRILDDKGKPVGVPIKASSFYNKPTLKYLEDRFAINETALLPHKARVKNAVDFALHSQAVTNIEQLIGKLKEDGIQTIIRKNAEGVIYGLTYVDHQTKCVFNGSTLGKQYSAKGVLERCGERKDFSLEKSSLQHSPGKINHQRVEALDLPVHQNSEKAGLLDVLLQPQNGSGYVPAALTKGGKKKRKKRASKRL
jgi:hypothetical protein